jgi:hypothetical protein
MSHSTHGSFNTPNIDHPNVFCCKPVANVSNSTVQEAEESRPLPATPTRRNDPLAAVHLLNHEDLGAQPHKTPGNTKGGSLYETYFTDWWLLEIICVIVAVTSIGAIIFILHIHDGKSVPPSKIPINTQIATFSTVAKGSIMIVVASCLSQLKWIWFTNRTRRLSDLQEFDNASRGAIGSLILLGKLKGGFVAVSFSMSSYC